MSLLTLFFWAITLGTILASRLVAGRWRWGYLAGGLLFGAYNEFFFEPCWTYSPVLGPFLWRDVSAMVITGWGGIGALTLTLGDRFSGRLSRWIGWSLPLTGIVLDASVYVAFGLTQELAMSRSGFWTYNFPFQGWLPIQFLGYVGVGLLIPALGRRLEALLP
ncbi:MAG: hypothetical protein H6686_03465 [Fibrobacteria bacterium]|nr:hypothetical protein [Fibrobacteria bacterium]